jgi:hypothetical protein
MEKTSPEEEKISIMQFSKQILADNKSPTL